MTEHDRNGIPRTEGDKTRAIERALQDPEWATLPARELARHIGVSHTLVNSIHARHLESGFQIDSEPSAEPAGELPAAEPTRSAPPPKAPRTHVVVQRAGRRVAA